jgi:hypothetical protein
MPIHYRNQIQETLVLRVVARCLRAWVQSPYTHKSHQTLYSFAIDLKTVVIPEVSGSL